MNKQSLLSLIVPVFNAEPYLEQCIASVLCQSYSHFELILVDDGSTDRSLQICEQYAQKDARIRLFHKENGGEASARNFGLLQARGEYVCWIDADDTVSVDYLADIVRYVIVDTDLVIQSLVRQEGTFDRRVCGVAAGSYNLDDPSDISAFFSNVNLDHFGVSVSKAFRLSIIRQHHLAYSSKIRLAVDLDFLFRYLCHCHRIEVADHANYYYIIRQGSVSNSIYDFDIESQGMRQISASVSLLKSRFSIPEVEQLCGSTIAAYIHRMLISSYKSQYNFSQRMSFFRIILPEEINLFRQYGPRQTLFLRLMNTLFVRHHYVSFDLLMLLVYRYRYPLS